METFTFTIPDKNEEQLCQNCNIRKGTENWVGDGNTVSYIHGFYQMWCKLCCVKTQLEHAKIIAAKIPELEKEIELLENNTNE